MSPISIAGAAAGLSLLVWLRYLSQIPKEKVPASPNMERFLLALASVAGLVAFAMSLQRGESQIASGALALTALGLSAFFVYLLGQGTLPKSTLQAALGEQLPAFKAPDSEGNLVGPQDWIGKPVLLKFFRGRW